MFIHHLPACTSAGQAGCMEETQGACFARCCVRRLACKCPFTRSPVSAKMCIPDTALPCSSRRAHYMPLVPTDCSHGMAWTRLARHPPARRSAPGNPPPVPPAHPPHKRSAPSISRSSGRPSDPPPPLRGQNLQGQERAGAGVLTTEQGKGRLQDQEPLVP